MSHHRANQAPAASPRFHHRGSSRRTHLGRFLRRRRVWPGGALLAAAAALLAPGTAAQQPVDSGVQEEVDVVLKEISILALDKQGHPILDLRPEDLQVTANRRPLRIAFLERDLENLKEQENLPKAKLYLKVGSEYRQVSTQPREPRNFIFFVDLQNNDLLLRPDALEAMRTFVRRRLSPVDRAAVVSYNGRLRLEQAFTSDPTAVEVALGRAFERDRRPELTLYRKVEGLIREAEFCQEIPDQGGVGPSAGAAIGTFSEPGLAGTGSFIPDLSCLQGLVVRYEQEHRKLARDFLQAIEETTHFASGLAGRTSVFAWSHGVSVDTTREVLDGLRVLYGPQIDTINLSFDTPVRNYMDRILEEAARERITFHFVDSTQAPVGNLSIRSNRILRAERHPLTSAYEQPQNDLRELAGVTGGVLVADRDVLAGLERAMDSEEGRYRLGVYLDASDERRRKPPPKVRIQPLRKEVKLVQGRLVRPAPEVPEAAEGRMSLGKVIELPDGKGFLLPFLVAYRAADLGFEYESGQERARLGLNFILQTRDGRHVASTYQMVDARVSPAPEGGESIFRMKGGLEGEPGDYRIIAVARNLDNGRAGVVVQEAALRP